MAQDRQNYLGIARSVGGKAWRQRLNKQGENIALHIMQKYGLPDVVARVLAARGVAAEGAPAFLDPSLRRLMPEPYSLQDMEKAAERLCRACLNREKIAIFGDYDVDGACSSALLARFLAGFSIKSRIYIPDRLTEGYGPNEKALRLLTEAGAKLIIIVDCGANNNAVLATAHRAGADILVLDHHQTASAADKTQTFTDFIHVNPNRFDDSSGLGYLCAAGVVYMCLTAAARLLRAKGVGNIPDLLGLLDLVALATICDIVPLCGLNRAFVKKGLLIARNQHNIGLKALVQAARISEPLNSYHFGYILGPRINAGGRIGDAALGARLLICDNAAEAEYIAAQLDSLNYGRQHMEAEQLRQALEQIAVETAKEQGRTANMVFACGNWHIGIIGLLAARLKEHFSLPAFIMTRQAAGQVTGSARSSRAMNIGRLIGQAAAEGVLEKGGGHKMAAGFSLKADKVSLFRNWLAEKLANKIAGDEAANIVKIDGSLSAGGASIELVEELEKAGPYGAGHDMPVFALPNHIISYVQAIGKDSAHLRLILADEQGNRLSAVAFRVAQTELGRFLQSCLGKPAHIAGTLSLNHWNGQVKPQFRIIDAAEAG